MRNLIDSLIRHYHWLLFLLLEVVSGVLLFRTGSYPGSVWLSSANVVTGKIYYWTTSVEQFFSLHLRNEQLTERNILLEGELQRLRREIAEAKDSTASAAQDSLNYEEELLSHYRVIAAKVVANEVSHTDNLITIDRGTDDGIHEDMAVASGLGVVGVVYMAGQHYSIVIPLLNRHSRLSCTLRGREYFGYLAWNGGRADEARLEDVPRHAVCEVGDWVETSGFSSIFPPGLTVGQVVSIDDSDDGLSYSLLLKLSTDFARLRDVCVITDSTFAERRTLLSQARDSLSTAK